MAIVSTDPIKIARGDALTLIIPLQRQRGTAAEPLPLTDYEWSLVDDVTYAITPDCEFSAATAAEAAYAAAASKLDAATHGWLHIFVPGEQNPPPAGATRVLRLRSRRIADPANDYTVRLRITTVSE